MKRKLNQTSEDYILMLPRWYPNIVDPADGNFIERHIRAIGHVHPLELIFVKGLKSIPKENFITEEYSNNVRIHLHYFKNRTGLFSPILNTYLYIKLQFEAFNKISSVQGLPSVCHVHVMARSSILACWLKLKHKIPFVISEHWSGYYDSSNKLSGFKKYFYSIILKYADKVTAVSKSLASELKKLNGNHEVVIIPNIVEDIFFNTNRNIQQTENSFRNIVHISNLHSEIKRVDQIILAYKAIRKQYSSTKLIIIGSGGAEKELKRMVELDKDLYENVLFLGEISPSEVANVLRSAWTSVLFSKFETQSIVMLESIAMGIPVIAPDVGGISEHCQDHGILYKVNSSEGFIASLEKMLDSKSAFIPSELRTYAAKRFKEEIIGEKFIQLYKQLKQSN